MTAKVKEASPFALALGQRLKEARGERTFQDVSNATGGYIHPRMVQYYEEGTEPKLSTFLALAAALGYRPAELLPRELAAASDKRDAERVVEKLVGF